MYTKLWYCILQVEVEGEENSEITLTNDDLSIQDINNEVLSSKIERVLVLTSQFGH